MTAEVTGEIESEGGVLVIKRIHVAYRLAAPESARETVERTHRIHAGHCPVARSIEAAIAVDTEYELIEEES